MHVITAVVVLVLGTATLLLHDKRFIQWKPTVLLGLTALAFLGSSVVGRQPLARRMLEAHSASRSKSRRACLDRDQHAVGRRGSRCSRC
jgi:intracellular septation protein A